MLLTNMDVQGKVNRKSPQGLNPTPRAVDNSGKLEQKRESSPGRSMPIGCPVADGQPRQHSYKEYLTLYGINSLYLCMHLYAMYIYACS